MKKVQIHLGVVRTVGYSLDVLYSNRSCSVLVEWLSPLPDINQALLQCARASLYLRCRQWQCQKVMGVESGSLEQIISLS